VGGGSGAAGGTSVSSLGRERNLLATQQVLQRLVPGILLADLNKAKRELLQIPSERLALIHQLLRLGHLTLLIAGRAAQQDLREEKENDKAGKAV
jgi:hypothetical protein